MSTKQPTKFPPALSAARRQIDQWRRRGRRRGRMPEALWRRAATLADKYGLNPTARALKLNYYSLKKHLAERAPKKVIPAQAASDFIELLPNMMTPGAVECRIEWTDSGAEKVKVSHKQLQPGDSCPECKQGTVYETAEPGRLVRICGQAPLGATVYELQKLRCNLCGKIFTASAATDMPART